MKRIFEKLFCLHKWASHSKEVYEWTEVVYYGVIHRDQEFKTTTEVLICEHCGKVKTIEY